MSLLTADSSVCEQQFPGAVYRQELPRHSPAACEHWAAQSSSASQWEHLNSVPGGFVAIIVVMII